MVLNEPETSLHPDLLTSLARLIARSSQRSQIIVVSHSIPLITALAAQAGCNSIVLKKHFGETTAVGANDLTAPRWRWPSR
jgi:predicted ATPase